MAKAKARTLRAWAVVCKSWTVHEVAVTREAAEAEKVLFDLYRYGCGPHTVVPLTGQWTGGEKKGKRNAR